MLQTVSKYVTFISELKEYIDNSPYKTSFIYESLEMSKQVFYRKLKSQTFTPNEVLVITKILFPKESYLEEIKADLQKSDDDYKNGRVLEHKEVMEKLRAKYL